MKDLQNEKRLLESLASAIRGQAFELKGGLSLSILDTTILFNRYLETETATLESTPTRFSILHNLITHGGVMTPTDISNKIFKSTHAVLRAIDALEEDGLVKRQPLAGDRRLRRVAITLKGLDFVASNLAEMRVMNQKVFSCLDTRQAEELSIILRQLREHLIKLIKLKVPPD